jgi:HTH-type transcriptional regulator/antitoxin HigA
MIKSSKQYEVTKRRLADFEAAIAQFDLAKKPPNISASGHQAAYDALLSLRDELAGQLATYDLVKREGVKAISFSRLADLPRILIQTRIARKMTQKALADALEIAPQQVQRWEAEDYENAGLSYVLEIGDVLNIDEVIAPQAHAPASMDWLANATRMLPLPTDTRQKAVGLGSAVGPIIAGLSSSSDAQGNVAMAHVISAGVLTVGAIFVVGPNEVSRGTSVPIPRGSYGSVPPLPPIQGQATSRQPSLMEAH